ncbi:NAD-glutamate dehydrogenase domain-containing protein [Criblamydia sequanensis]|uniref:NAD-specific glutamate dehydrogenase n=1 Tax=Candidatus Criblamydia sequanensis CRIB-18 TaxID=1437425 RepID=A0A090E1Y8_9BACT|nr:NAD-glutamate dehydrogenase domain-containing protein [Criblamydia sequanensis]CDR34724.1 Putative NAD-specific glutamate dehydrogenase [Criblamydia sequanensis CRIB-18]
MRQESSNQESQELEPSIKQRLQETIKNESRRFEECYSWLEEAMSPAFFEEFGRENVMLIVHSLMGFHLQDYFSTIHLKRAAICICLDSPDADLRILKNYAFYGIKYYQTFISKEHFPGTSENVRIAILLFTGAQDLSCEIGFPKEEKEKLKAYCQEKNPNLTQDEFSDLFNAVSPRFIRSLSTERLALALDLFLRAKTRDNCQYEVRYNEDWEKTGDPSMQIVLAWRNCPKHNFLYRLARTIHRHGLTIKRVNATYIDPYSRQNILIMALGLHGSDGKAAWDVADIPDFLRELVTVKYFASFDLIDEKLVSKGIISGTMGNLLRAIVNFAHQGLVHLDPNLYTIENIEEALCRHPELTGQLAAAFKYKFDPNNHDYITYLNIRGKFLDDVEKLDTGQEVNDIRRKNVLRQGMNFIHHTLKTNFYRLNFTAFSFRLDPKYLDELPFDRKKKFPDLPYAIFFIKGMHFFGFHIRFKDLSRGGLRTVIPKEHEDAVIERNTIFTECYNLAYTQHFKNKDIPEGGSKGVLFLLPFQRIESESAILKKELIDAFISEEDIVYQVERFQKEQNEEFLYQAQRSYIESLITIVNCDPDGKIRAKNIIDYWKRPEYLYLGPDENMHDGMIEWIADFSKKYHYRPGSSFISGKPKIGINHKEYGVTSLGVNVYMEEVLKYLDIDPKVQPFTLKMSGGPDGDVAGNQIKNLYLLYKNTAKLLAITDVSGTINDPHGLDLDTLYELFRQGKPIKYYPPEKLHENGFLLDRQAKRSETAFAQQTLCWRKKQGVLQEEWLSGSEMNHLFKNNVHETKADIFIPAGGRPRTLNEGNIKEFLDERGEPTAKAIIEGANLYLTPKARDILQDKGCLIVKDSSANKTGVICSSFEVLSGLTLGDKLFLENKRSLVKEILERLKLCAFKEAELLLKTHKKKGIKLTEISNAISVRINHFTYEILDYLDPIALPKDPNHPLNLSFFDYCLPILREKYKDLLLSEIPEHHKKAIISAHIAANLVYAKGLDWHPSVVDILPLLLNKQTKI